LELNKTLFITSSRLSPSTKLAPSSTVSQSGAWKTGTAPPRARSPASGSRRGAAPFPRGISRRSPPNARVWTRTKTPRPRRHNARLSVPSRPVGWQQAARSIGALQPHSVRSRGTATASFVTCVCPSIGTRDARPSGPLMPGATAVGAAPAHACDRPGRPEKHPDGTGRSLSLGGLFASSYGTPR